MKNHFVFNTLPKNEKQRISALRSYGILQGPHEPAFDTLIRFGAQLFEVPIAMITLVETDIVYVVSGKGIGKVTEEPRKTSICSLTILKHEVTVFEDTNLSPCLLSNPWVAGEFGLKFYAGAPLSTPEGLRIGTICLLDFKPRKFSKKNKSVLENLASLVMDIAGLVKTKNERSPLLLPT
ncbi:GAF domain-containing protein [Pedobacter foliorum]|uniref:GAF domain-containing protein n=1 Tax=Pedobacter foliorum TaxID=2739058 RepID=UPI00156548B3|nr:GAF domain-containing protein [Pedobacter foliorum]NRF37668.1 GAF domain-containing protein [Pedobacter foliorum]